MSRAVGVRWGILSTALINRKFLAGARAAAGVEVIAVASRDGATAARYAQEHGIERDYSGYETLLADEDVEAVYISLPNSLHIEWTVRALEAGKHVLCEKPLGRRADEVAHAFAVAERNDRLLMEAFMYRHNPQTQRMMTLLAEGAIGRLRLIRGAFGFFTTDSANVRFSALLSGGALMDVGCYCVSAARLLAGEPRSVAAQAVLGGDGVDVLFSGILSFPGDVLAHFDAGLSIASREELEVVGEEASLFLADPWHCDVPVIERRDEHGVERIELEPVDSYGLEAANFSAAIRGGAAPLLGRDDAIGQARVIEALYLAAESGRSVSLS